MGTKPMRTPEVEGANAFTSWMMKMQEEAKAALEHAEDKMAQYYDRNWRAVPVYKVRDKVWLNTQNYTMD